MIISNVYILSYGPGGLTSNIRVTVRSDADGISSVQIRDHTGMPLTELLPLNCAPQHQFDVPDIPSGQSPVFVWADECTDGQPSGQLRPSGPFHVATGGVGMAIGTCPPPSVGAPPSQQCLAALGVVRSLRNIFISTCDRVRRQRWHVSRYTALAIAAYAFAGVFTTAAIVTFVHAGAATATPYSAAFAPAIAAVGYILLAIASVNTTGAVAATVQAVRKQRALTASERELDAISEQFRSAAMNVSNCCCSGDFLDVDVTLPTCQ